MDDKILERVRALLAKAEATDYAAEAETYTAKAAEMMAKHGIDAALVAEKAERRESVEHRRIDVLTPYPVDKRNLLFGLAQAMRCKAVHTRTRRGDQYMTVFGFPSDLERVELLYTSLLLQMTRLATKVRSPRPEWESTRTYRKSWMQGFVRGAFERVSEAEERAAQGADAERGVESGSTALVLRDRSALVDDKVAEVFPRLGKMRVGQVRGSGYGEGHAAGRRADVGATQVGGGGRAALR